MINSFRFISELPRVTTNRQIAYTVTTSDQILHFDVSSVFNCQALVKRLTFENLWLKHPKHKHTHTHTHTHTHKPAMHQIKVAVYKYTQQGTKVECFSGSKLAPQVTELGINSNIHEATVFHGIIFGCKCSSLEAIVQRYLNEYIINIYAY